MRQPPTDMVTPHVVNIVTTSIIALVVLALGAYAVRTWRRTGDRTGLLMIGGGFICAFNEPLVDMLGHCYFPRTGGWVVFENFGRPMPVWLVLAYPLYFGGLAWLTSRFLKSRPSRSTVFRALGALVVVDLCLEIPNLNLGLYTYYGPQPFEVFGFPLVWESINSFGALLGAVVLVRLGQVFQGRRQLLLLLVPVSTYFVSWVTALPHFYMLNSGAPVWVMWIATTATIAINVMAIRFLVISVTPEPARAEPAPARAGSSIAVGA